MRSDIERYLAGRPVQAPAVAARRAGRRRPDRGVTTTPRPRRRPRSAAAAGHPGSSCSPCSSSRCSGSGPSSCRRSSRASRTRSRASVIGQNEDTARAQLGDWTADHRDREPDPEIPVDEVIDQDPADGDQVDEGATIALVVSNGPPRSRSPTVVGDDRATPAGSSGRPVCGSRRDLASDEDAGEVPEHRPGRRRAGAGAAGRHAHGLEGPVAVPTVIGLDEPRRRRRSRRRASPSGSPRPGQRRAAPAAPSWTSRPTARTQPQGRDRAVRLDFEPTPTEEPVPPTPSEPDDSTVPATGTATGTATAGGNGNGTATAAGKAGATGRPAPASRCPVPAGTERPGAVGQSIGSA